MKILANLDHVATALELISVRVPDRHVTPDDVMAATWLEDLARFDHVVVLRAGREWNGLRFPAVAEFVDACSAVARTMALEEADAQRAEQGAHARGELALSSCSQGCDAGWVMVDTLDATGTVRPCSVCCPVEFAVWEHRLPPHDEGRCRECAMLRGRSKEEPLWLAAAREQAARVGPSPLRASEVF